MNSYRVILFIILSTCVIICCIGQPCENKYGKGYNVTIHEDRCCIVILCLAGHIPVKCKENEPSSTKCVKCSSEEFKSQSSNSDVMMICSAHTNCNNEQITIGGGNITHDYICQCNIEKGFINSTSIYQSTSSELKCKNVCPAGQQMVGSEGCTSCQKGYFKPKGESTCMPCLDCSDVGMATILFCNGTHNNTRCSKICSNGTYLNGEDCVPCTNCSASNRDTLFACNQSTDSICSTLPSEDAEKKESSPDSNHNQDLWWLIVPFILIIAVIVVVVCYCRRKREKEKCKKQVPVTGSSKPLIDGQASDSWKKKIQRNYVELVTRMKFDELYGFLLKSDEFLQIFSESRLNSINESRDSSEEKNTKFLDALINTKEEKAFNQFCQALTASQQDHIVTEILNKNEEPTEDVKPNDVTLSHDKKKCLKDHYDEIKDSMHSDALFFAWLTQLDTFTEFQISKLKSIEDMYDRNAQIIKFIRNGSEKQWTDLCFALTENKQGHIINDYLRPKKKLQENSSS